jgi:RNA polymerase sigma-70 factor (ECF subfamily)
MDAAEEARVIAAARAGDLAAYGKLVDAHQNAVRAFLRRLVGNYADADDLAQEAFARTWEVLHRYNATSSLRTFICGVAFQFWRRRRRSTMRRLAREEAYHAAEAMQGVIAPTEAMKLALRRALDELPEGQRAALALCIGGDFSHAEAAEALGLPLGTVKSHVARGLQRLKLALGADPGKDR